MHHQNFFGGDTSNWLCMRFPLGSVGVELIWISLILADVLSQPIVEGSQFSIIIVRPWAGALRWLRHIKPLCFRFNLSDLPQLRSLRQVLNLLGLVLFEIVLPQFAILLIHSEYALRGSFPSRLDSRVASCWEILLVYWVLFVYTGQRGFRMTIPLLYERRHIVFINVIVHTIINLRIVRKWPCLIVLNQHILLRNQLILRILHIQWLLRYLRLLLKMLRRLRWLLKHLLSCTRGVVLICLVKVLVWGLLL